jgi:hypothetical protein
MVLDRMLASLVAKPIVERSKQRNTIRALL